MDKQLLKETQKTASPLSRGHFRLFVQERSNGHSFHFVGTLSELAREERDETLLIFSYSTCCPRRHLSCRSGHNCPNDLANSQSLITMTTQVGLRASGGKYLSHPLGSFDRGHVKMRGGKMTFRGVLIQICQKALMTTVHALVQ